eukprot:GHVQ01018737.1.p1 GENE.GHVQ01018737.1~~GHVQ01018737.1.p1  ORF type:complete len:485 (-),score=91.36 GHVQ01018737.1:323-1777(-)
MTLTRYRGRGGEGGICMPHLFNSLCMLFLLCNLLFTTFSVAMTVRRTNPLDPAQAPLSGVGGGAGEIGMDERNAASDVNGRDGVRKWWAGDAVDTPSVYAATEGESQTVGGDVITSSSSVVGQQQQPQVEDTPTDHIINQGGAFVQRGSSKKKTVFTQLVIDDAPFVLWLAVKKAAKMKFKDSRNFISFIGFCLKSLRFVTSNDRKGAQDGDFRKALTKAVGTSPLPKVRMPLVSNDWISALKKKKIHTVRGALAIGAIGTAVEIFVILNQENEITTKHKSMFEDYLTKKLKEEKGTAETKKTTVLPVSVICALRDEYLRLEIIYHGKHNRQEDDNTVIDIIGEACSKLVPSSNQMKAPHTTSDEATKTLAAEDAVGILAKSVKKLKGPWKHRSTDVIQLVESMLKGLRRYTKNTEGYDTPEFGTALQAALQRGAVLPKSLPKIFGRSVIDKKWNELDKEWKDSLKLSPIKANQRPLIQAILSA